MSGALDKTIARAEGFLKRFRDRPVAHLIDGKQDSGSGQTFETLSPIDNSVIDALPTWLGLDSEVFRRDLDSVETRARHEALIDEAHARGAFGVPTFFLGGRMFWGNDRLPLLEAALRGVALPRRR